MIWIALDHPNQVGRPIGEPPTEQPRQHDTWVTTLATGALEGRPVIVSGDFGGTVRVWDLADRKPIGEPLRGHQGGGMHSRGNGVGAVAVGALEGRPVIVSGGDVDGIVRTWETNDWSRRTLNVGSGVNAIALVPPSTLVAGCSRGLIVLRLLPAGHSDPSPRAGPN